ncbi:WG repeat-containing protein [Actinoplanes sp. URMC 104]|uniref:WG repeat-containing protein n=1 Tax=Actinoplanes sp. URMC 104 TaxID=3423409 RepID=UPI003F1DA713
MYAAVRPTVDEQAPGQPYNSEPATRPDSRRHDLSDPAAVRAPAGEPVGARATTSEPVTVRSTVSEPAAAQPNDTEPAARPGIREEAPNSGGQNRSESAAAQPSAGEYAEARPTTGGPAPAQPNDTEAAAEPGTRDETSDNNGQDLGEPASSTPSAAQPETPQGRHTPDESTQVGPRDAAPTAAAQDTAGSEVPSGESAFEHPGAADRPGDEAAETHHADLPYADYDEPIAVQPILIEQPPKADPAPAEPETADDEPIEAELIDFEPLDDVHATADALDDDIVDAELVDDAPREVAGAIEAPAPAPAITAEPAANPAAADPAAADPAEADPAAADPAEAEPAAADPVDATEPGGRNDDPPRPIRQNREQRADPRNRRTDPEQILAAYPVTYDPRTLREQIEDDEPMWVVIDRLTDKLEYAERDADRARLLSLRAVASRLLDDLDPALEDARAALMHAEAAGDLVRTATVRARLAHVLQWRGDYAEADRIYAEANSAELPARLRAEIFELAGRSAFEQGRYLEAVNHLESALDLRKGADPDLVERIELALDTITGRAAEGWGPYPRNRDEIVGGTGPVRPLQDEASGLWGYPGSLTPRFAQAQPFADGVAWVRLPEAPAWELIDESGEVLIDASSGYRAAGRYAEGLAWVSRDDAGGWFAIDKQDRVIVPGGFDDARPFRNGLALVRRGGWGAVDRHGRVVVQPHYRAFATMLASGEPVDGFTDEGLAVVDAGEVYGVVDRAGQLLVQPVHAALLIHPVAFLVADRFGLWGALTRDGRPLVELKYSERADVLEEIGKLIKDTRPVL